MQTRLLRYIRMWSGGCMAVCLALGCASAPKEPVPDDYVFFGRSPNLERVSAKRGVFLYVNPKRPIGDYGQFIVESAGIFFQPKSSHWIDKAKSDELAAYFCEQVKANLSDVYKVVKTPGPGVLRISLALGDVRRVHTGTTTGKDAEEYQPVLRILLKDSQDGEDILLLRDITRGSEFAEALDQRGEAGAKELLREWAKLLREKIDEARRSSGQAS